LLKQNSYKVLLSRMGQQWYLICKSLIMMLIYQILMLSSLAMTRLSCQDSLLCLLI